MESFSEYLASLYEGEDDKKLQDLNDDCDDCDDEKGETGDDEDDDVNESAQVQLDLLKQIQPKLANAPLSLLKRVLKLLEAGTEE